MTMHTVWFPHAVAPARAGVYQRDYGDPGVPDIHYCWFDGQNWHAYCDTPDHARSEVIRSLVPAPWRGLTLDEFCMRHKDQQRQLLRRIEDARP